LALPKDILITRVKNELLECQKHLRHRFSVSDVTLQKFPVEVMVTLVETPGPYMDAHGLGTLYTHQFKIIITDQYPFQTPIVRWKTKIFHPNIMPPDDGGYVCTRLLDGWSFNSNLLSFIKGIESLLANPNPDNPYESDSCTRAAEYFNKHSYAPPDVTPTRKKPIVVSEENNE
jgi:ubiquitin-protein ligase